MEWILFSYFLNIIVGAAFQPRSAFIATTVIAAGKPLPLPNIKNRLNQYFWLIAEGGKAGIWTSMLTNVKHSLD
jgi:hypothetical protein